MDRELGSTIAVSKGTAVPLETLVKSGKPLEYKCFYINIKTLYRNFISSFPSGSKPSEEVIHKELLAEINTISGIVSTTLPGSVTPVLYLTTYKSVDGCLPKAILKMPKTALQVENLRRENRIVGSIANSLGDKLLIFDCKIDGNKTNSVILTHLPMDLLSYTTFNKLTLVESHTGNLKSRSEWITKITRRDDCKNMPFNVMTIQIFGDNNNLLSQYGKKVIDSLVELAKESRWFSLTTKEKILFDVGKMPDKYLVEILKIMIRNTLT